MNFSIYLFKQIESASSVYTLWKLEESILPRRVQITEFPSKNNVMRFCLFIIFYYHMSLESGVSNKDSDSYRSINETVFLIFFFIWFACIMNWQTKPYWAKNDSRELNVHLFNKIFLRQCAITQRHKVMRQSAHFVCGEWRKEEKKNRNFFFHHNLLQGYHS